MKDYYSILGISKSVSQADIKKAFRRKAIELHPDKNQSPSAKQDFIELTEAYEVLSNKTRRKSYDNIQNPVFNSEQKTRYEYQKWEQDVNSAAESGRSRGQKYAEDFSFFSKEFAKISAQVILLEIAYVLVTLLISLIFSSTNSSKFPPLLLIFAGPMIAYHNQDLTFAIVIGVLMTLAGLYIIGGRINDAINERGGSF
ncbi:MAG: J domain-containing protein [Flavobacterium sp.]|nr:MAG: J domain-containing protein [Flavobacterium sp.]